MSDLRDLYQEVILDHSKRPRNFHAIAGASRKAEGYNPLCGDRETVYLVLEGDRVRDVAFQGAGCAISTASASMMTESVKGKTRAEAEALFARFHELITGKNGEAGPGIAARPGARQARGVLGRARVPRAREVRDAALAHAEGRPGVRGRARGRLDGVGRSQRRVRRSLRCR